MVMRGSLFGILKFARCYSSRGGTSTLFRYASFQPVGQRDPHPGLPVPACHVLAAGHPYPEAEC